MEKGGSWSNWMTVCAGKDSDVVCFTEDYCYRIICGIPQTFEEVMRSENSEGWRNSNSNCNANSGSKKSLSACSNRLWDIPYINQPKGYEEKHGSLVYKLE